MRYVWFNNITSILVLSHDLILKTICKILSCTAILPNCRIGPIAQDGYHKKNTNGQFWGFFSMFVLAKIYT